MQVKAQRRVMLVKTLKLRTDMQVGAMPFDLCESMAHEKHSGSMLSAFC